MASNTTGATKLNAQLEIAAIEYAGETKLVKLRKNNGWNFTSSSKRGRLEIMAEILCYCNQQKAKTDIMYKANLNYTQLKKHLKSLISQGLLKTSKNKYATTQKGYRFLELFFQLNDILNS
jgi:predicted transcriptional regulator